MAGFVQQAIQAAGRPGCAGPGRLGRRRGFVRVCVFFGLLLACPPLYRRV